MIYETAPAATVVAPVIAPPPAGATGPAPMVPQAGGRSPLLENTASLTVQVPPDAEVFVNGVKTKTTGSERRYRSSGLVAGQAYSYEVRAVVERNGNERAITKRVSLIAGGEESVDFQGLDAAITKTQVTLHLPADATVNLAGNELEAGGPKRVFTTARLAPGETWSDYRIRVTVHRDGREISKEKSVALHSGQEYVFRFDFDESLLAFR